MSAPGSRARRPDGAALVIAALLAGLAVLVFWQTKAMPVGAQYARVGPTTMPYVMSGFLAVLAVGHVLMAFRHGLPEREADRTGPMLWIVGGLVLQMLLLKPPASRSRPGCCSPARRGASARGRCG